MALGPFNEKEVLMVKGSVFFVWVTTRALGPFNEKEVLMVKGSVLD
jgi:hypothetical protein